MSGGSAKLIKNFIIRSYRTRYAGTALFLICIYSLYFKYNERNQFYKENQAMRNKENLINLARAQMEREKFEATFKSQAENI